MRHNNWMSTLRLFQLLLLLKPLPPRVKGQLFRLLMKSRLRRRELWIVALQKLSLLPPPIREWAMNHYIKTLDCTRCDHRELLYIVEEL